MQLAGQPTAKSVTTMPPTIQSATMFGMPATTLLLWADIVYFGSLAVAALAAVANLGAGILQHRLNARIAVEHEAEFRAFKTDADVKMALANQRAAEANLEIAKLRTPRSLSDEQARALTVAAARFPGTSFDVTISPGPEASPLCEQITSALEKGRWVWVANPKASNIVFTFPNKPAAGINLDIVGIGLEIDSSRQADLVGSIEAVGGALRSYGLHTEIRIANDGSAAPNAVHLFVGSKPQ